jgi:hypothetical protein
MCLFVEKETCGCIAHLRSQWRVLRAASGHNFQRAAVHPGPSPPSSAPTMISDSRAAGLERQTVTAACAIFPGDPRSTIDRVGKRVYAV